MKFNRKTDTEQRTREFVDKRDKSAPKHIYEDPRGQETIERAINEILRNEKLVGFTIVAILSKDTKDPLDMQVLEVGGGMLNLMQQIVMAKSLQTTAERAMADTEALLKHIEEKRAEEKE